MLETPFVMSLGCTGNGRRLQKYKSGQFVAKIRGNRPSTGDFRLTVFVSPRSNVALHWP